jgi:alpha-amylase
VTAWLGNELQNDAFNKLNDQIEKLSLLNDEALWSDFGHLQESDHFYYMCTTFFSDGAVHKYFNPYDTPYEAFINYMNVLSDFILRVDDAISVSDVNFAAAKPKKAPAKKTVKAKAAPKAKAEPKAKKPATKKTTKK